MFLTAVIVASLLYVLAFVVLWSQTRFAARPGRTSRAQVRVTPWGKHLHVEAPSDAAAADALLRADLQLAREGK